uniref:CSON005411 protein n=1 Tax=Culicoides sonorensis TaxID=179676 RepID=A0A336M6Z6_CULSO
MTHFQLETRNHHSGDGTDSSGGGSSITSDFESMSLSGLMNDLKREIITKEEVLKSRQIIIDNLELCLSEMKRHMARLEQENHNFNKSNSDLSKKVIAVEKEKEEVEEKKQELDKMIADYQQQLETIKQEKQQLEFEHANQSQTISHLRRVLEETKRSGTATVSPSSSSSFLSTFFRSVHDV